MREKLIEILRKPIFPHELVDPIEAVADYLLDNGVTVQKWIPVSERLPDEEHERVVLVYSGDVEPAIVSGDTFLEYDKYEGWEIYNVTHWMPLPEPPEGE